MFRIKLSKKKYRELCEYVFIRDCWCLVCGDPFNATPAHVKRRSQGGDDSPQNMIRLCTGCHSAYDKYEIELPKWIFEMLKKEPKYL